LFFGAALDQQYWLKCDSQIQSWLPLWSSTMNRRSATEIARELDNCSYLARQHADESPYYLNLGGPKSRLDDEDFNGMVLLNPATGLIFGTCPSEVRTLRERTMFKEQGKWKRRADIMGPSNDERVPVSFQTSVATNPKLYCPIGSQRLWIEGVAENLQIDEDCYDWDEVKRFLQKLRPSSTE
jgi:hypothetical protein